MMAYIKDGDRIDSERIFFLLHGSRIESSFNLILSLNIMLLSPFMVLMITWEWLHATSEAQVDNCQTTEI